MQKTDLITKVSKETNVNRDNTAKVINGAITAIVEALKGGDKVTLTGFGTFEVRKTAARVGTNPSTREKIQIPAGKRATFSAGTVLRNAVAPKETSKAEKTQAPAADKSKKPSAKKKSDGK